MDASVTVHAGVVCGMPVRPDLLLQQLQKYEKILPALRTLRLCHRFGGGPNVHINRLPVEVRLIIEGFLVRMTPRASNEATEAFLHFENKCEPIDHLSDEDLGHQEHGEQLAALQNVQLFCEICRASDEDPPPHDCEDEHVLFLKEIVNTNSVENPNVWTKCAALQAHWEELIDQRPGGAFVKYDELLREYFGVEAFFKWTKRASGMEAPWPEVKHWDWKDEPRSMICYLTLPKRMAPVTQYESLQTDRTEDGFNFGGLQSSYVQLPALDDRTKRVEQFRYLRQSLQLEPFVHQSSLNAVTSPVYTGDDSTVPDSAEVEWPQLIMLVHTSVKVEDPGLDQTDLA